MKVKALFISDVHLGSKGSNAHELLSILKKYEPANLFIVGDFIDGWLLKSRHYWKKDFTQVIRKILSLSENGCRITYVTGNHDDFLRQYTPFDLGKNIKIVDECIWNNHLITHGDLYDGVVQMKWLGMLGGWGYEVAITIDRTLKQLGYKKSLSKWIKQKVKNAVKFIVSFEKQLIYQAQKRGCAGVVCGHIHTPEIKEYHGMMYINCGDWIENNSYVIYDKHKFEIKYFKN